MLQLEHSRVGERALQRTDRILSFLFRIGHSGRCIRSAECSCRGSVSVVGFEWFLSPGTATANRLVLIEFFSKETCHALDTRRNQ